MQSTQNSPLINPFTVHIDFAELVMSDPDAHNKRPASVMRGYYRDANALERLIAENNDPLHYETYEKHVPEEYGHLLFCISKIQPGVVGEEFFMTKGHYHTRIETGEVYFCLQGQGYMVMKTKEGLFDAQRMERGSLVYVPPYWAHRSVNTGGEPLTMLAVWPADAGHNYGDIESEGFPKRVFQRADSVVME
ncbi:MAG: glucose-6-phosphate isomerase family protein [Verrucomicrobiae bacterium]